ncbi:MAG: DUF692 domain-containing protein [Nakamurella sp.]
MARTGSAPTRTGTVAGVGIGWRPEIDGAVRSLPGLRWCEVVAESIDPQSLPDGLLGLRDDGVAVVPHGVRVNLGSADEPDHAQLDRFAAVAAALQAPLVSEHISFVRAGGVDVGHLTPLPRTWDAVEVMVRNVATFRSAVGLPIALEPIAALFDWPDAELTEGQFITEICERSDALLLLDVANVHANSRNATGAGAGSALSLFDEIPLERIAYVHIAGGDDHDGIYHDTHTAPVSPAVLELLTQLCGRHPIPAVMLERDGNYPPQAEIFAELDSIAESSGHPRITAASTAAAGAAATTRLDLPA